ncbi:MAG TPA: alpha/beta hydrolase [Kofleriaceae bacterium]|jgi:hypothetical protein
MHKLLACLLLVAASGCPDVKADMDEGQGQLPSVDGPTVEFDPANSIIPFPNNLVLDPMTGKVSVPAPACESPVSAAIRTGILNTLDGFGTFEAAMQVTFTDPVDANSLQGKIVMYERQQGATPNDPSTAKAVPVKLTVGTTLRFDPGNCSAPTMVDAVTVVPMVPLDEKSTYTVAVLDGVMTADGRAFLPSFTWALVRQSVDPVTVDSQGNIIANTTPLDPTSADQGPEILAIDKLWKAEATGLAFLDGTGTITDRSQVLVGWEVTTQTTTDPLDPSIVGSPASKLSTATLVEATSQITGVTCPGAGCGLPPSGTDVTNFLENELIAAGLATGGPSGDAVAVCNELYLCGVIGDVLGGALAINNYQTHTPNPLANGVDLPGAWSDPINPMPQAGFATVISPAPVPAGLVEFVAFVPAIPPPATGYPVVVFGHGLGSEKETLILFAGALATQGIASIAIDDVNSGSRAIRITDDPTIGCGPGVCNLAPFSDCYNDLPTEAACTGTGNFCGGAPSYSTTPQCYQSFLTTDLAATRDTMRQTLLDLQRVILATKGCGATQSATNPCGTLAVDPTKIMYAGISLGGILGTTTSSIDPNIGTALLNVPGVGWLDILENSSTNEIKCPLVDALISDGVLTGAQWNGMDGSGAVGLCTTSDWKTQPTYQQFAQTARWILDPADGANFVSNRLPAKKFLIEEVVNDQVVPNVATDDLGGLVGLMAGSADTLTPLTESGNVQPTLFDPSAALHAMPTTSQWLRYNTLAAGDPTDPWGIAYQHASLLEPVTGLSGQCALEPQTACTDNTPCTGGGPDQCVFPGNFGTLRLQADGTYFLKQNE